MSEYQPHFECDSSNYEVITEGVAASAGVPGMTCEIGLRLGGGSKFIFDALVATKQSDKTHIAIDPYGSIAYYTSDALGAVPGSYSNQMRDTCQINMFAYARTVGINYVFFNLDDKEFFRRFSDGVPIYQQNKKILTDYSFVHFDGPHGLAPLYAEIAFFHERTPRGAVFVFDDVEFYDHSKIDNILRTLGWQGLARTTRKWSYVKTS